MSDVYQQEWSCQKHDLVMHLVTRDEMEQIGCPVCRIELLTTEVSELRTVYDAAKRCVASDINVNSDTAAALDAAIAAVSGTQK